MSARDEPADESAEGSVARADASEPSARARDAIEAWEKKRVVERGPNPREDLGDDAESGGP